MARFAFASALLIAAVQPALLFAADSSRRPNVLFLFADDQRADTIAALGNSAIKTPNLDRLVKRGVSFDRAYMQGGFNAATCVPSRAMLLSGRNLFHVDEKLLRHETWPQAFQRAGYTTFMTGKWHNGPASLPRAFQQARGVFSGGMTNPMQARLSELKEGRLSAPLLAPKHACAVFADHAIEFVSRSHERPFFCYVPFDAPHDPHIVPDDFPVHYRPEEIPVPANFLPQHPWDNGEMEIRDERLLKWPRTHDSVRAMLAEYFRYVSYLDAEIGRILEALERSPNAGNTIVVFTSDSGVARGGHGLIGKQNCYEHSLRVPLIVAGPGVKAGERSNGMCYLFDVLPTLADLCGVAGPETYEGVSFAKCLKDPALTARTQLVFGYKAVQRAIRTERWKLIRYPQVDRTQLFDLQTDPWETRNLADQSEHAETVRLLLKQLQSELQREGDSAPLTVAQPRRAEWQPPKE